MYLFILSEFLLPHYENENGFKNYGNIWIDILDSHLHDKYKILDSIILNLKKLWLNSNMISRNPF